MPVSYTHLDGYKRQENSQLQQATKEIVLFGLFRFCLVYSASHKEKRDVYKRQVFPSVMTWDLYFLIYFQACYV